MQHNSDNPSQPVDPANIDARKDTGAQKSATRANEKQLNKTDYSNSGKSSKIPTRNKSIDGGILHLSQIISMTGMNLKNTLATLAARGGRQGVYVDPSNEDREKEITKLLNDPKAASRLRIILSTGLQQGAKKQVIHPFWDDILEVTDKYLQRINPPLKLSLAIKKSTLSDSDYRTLWSSLTNREKSKKIPSIKELIAIQEILVLDVYYAYWKDLIAESAILSALAAFEFDETSNLPQRSYLPWRPAIALATTLPGSVIISQANSIHNFLANAKHALLIANSKIESLLNEISQLTQQLEDTSKELDHNISLLTEANKKIIQLEADVIAAGSIHRHKADELRSRYKGMMEGEVDKHLQTIQRAAEMSPPRANVIMERVETLLGTLTRELKWLEDME